MITASSSTSVIDSDMAPEPETKLRLMGDDAANSSADPMPKAVFSSIKQTAVALATAASGQASLRARTAARTVGGVRSAIAEAERLEYAVQRSNADQARRVAECTRAAFDALVRHTLHPCISLDEAGRIIRWNSAMAAWTGIAADAALYQPLATIFEAGTAAAIEEANTALREAEEEPGGVDADPVFIIEGIFTLNNRGSAGRVALLPLCRVPRVVEEVVVLITPAA